MSAREWITGAVLTCLYGAIAAGILILLEDRIRAAYRKRQMKQRLAVKNQKLEAEGQFLSHIRMVLETSLKYSCEPRFFLWLSAWIFLIMFAMGVRYGSPFSAGITALAAGGMPYLLLRVRLESIRRKGSFEGEKLVSNFLRQYRISSFNIYETLERLISSTEETRVCKKLLFKLLMELRSTGDPKRVRLAADTFAYGINTNWSRMLANNIRLSAEKGTNVSLAVEDILIQLREARTLMEERKRLNSESTKITLILVPLLYGATVLLSVRYLELPVSHFFYNQIGTSEGFTMLLAIGFLFLMNTAILEMVNHQKFDF